MKNQFLILIAIFQSLLFSSCYKDDSIYRPIAENQPEVGVNNNFSIDGNAIIVTGEIKRSGAAALLKYGHIWGTSSKLDFIDKQYSGYQEVKHSQNASIPTSFQNRITNFDINKILYVASFAINEAGISYSSPIQVSSNISYTRYEILQEGVNDKRITPGEKIKLRLYFANKSPINSISTQVKSISRLSDYIVSIVPNENLTFSPRNLLTNIGEYTIDLELTIASNANGNINLEATIINSFGTQVTSISLK